MGFLDHAETAGKGMLQVAVVCTIGVLIAKYPKPHGLLPASSMKVVSTLLSFVFAPAITLSSFSTEMTLEMFKEAGFVSLIAAVVMIGVSFVVGWMFTYISNTPMWFRKYFVMAATFNNAFSIPIILIESLLNSIPELARSDETEDEAFDRATVFILSFLVVWQIVFWTVALAEEDSSESSDDLGDVTATATAATAITATAATTATATATDGDIETTSPSSADLKAVPIGPQTPSPTSAPAIGASRELSLAALHPACATAKSVRQLPALTKPPSRLATVKSVLRRAFGTPPTLATFVGLALGLTGVGRKAFFNDGAPLRFLGGAITILSKPAVVLPSLVMAAGLVQGLARARKAQKASKEKKIRNAADAPATSSAPGQPASSHLEPTEPTVSDAAVPKSSPSLPGSTDDTEQVVVQVGSSSADLIAPTTTTTTPPEEGYLISSRTAACLIFCRLIVCPLVFFGLFLAAKSAGFIPDDTLLQLTLLVQAAAPSPNMLMVVASMKGNQRASASLALTYIPMYLMSVVTMSVFVTWALDIVGTEDQ